MVSKMFPFITCTWNPLGGACQYNCKYCWAKALIQKNKFAKYQGEPVLFAYEIEKGFKDGSFVFVQDMTDLFGPWVGRVDILAVLDVIRNNPEATFLLLTKNPARYLEFEDVLPENVVCGATIETDLDSIVPRYSLAPFRFERIEAIVKLQFPRKMVSIEPILEFNHLAFAEQLLRIKPEFVAVGMDNYGNNLPEPTLEKTLALIGLLEKAGVKVYRKTLRKAWNEK